MTMAGDWIGSAMSGGETSFVFPARADAPRGACAAIRRSEGMDGWEFSDDYGDGTDARWEPVPAPVADRPVDEIARAVQAVVWDRDRKGAAA